MNYGEIRRRVIERLSEYQGGAAEAVVDASFSGQTIYDRIIESYRDMVDEVADRDPEKVITTTTLAYAANTESVALPAAVLHRRIHSVELRVRSSPTTIWTRIPRLTFDQADEANASGGIHRFDSAGYGFRIEREEVIYLVPTPRQAETLRFRYVATIPPIEDDTDDDEEPSLIPEEHHALLALRTAISFLSETGAVPPDLRSELARREARFNTWAAVGPQEGPRYVHQT